MGRKSKKEGMYVYVGFSGGSVVKNLPVNAGDTGYMGSIPELKRTPGEEMATRSSILAWEITVHGAAKSQT